MIWWKSLYELIITYEKDNRKERREILEKNNIIIIKIRKKIMNNQWIENTSTIKKSRYSNKNVERENYVFTVTKRNIKSRNAEKSKTAHQVNEFFKKFDSKLKSLKIKQEQIKKKVKATSSW